jgi:hypothetical protein
MAEDIQVNAPLGNGERLELKVGSKSLGVTTKDLVSLVVMLGAFAGFYLVSEHLNDGQKHGFAGLAKILEQNNAHQAQLLEKISLNQASLIEIVHQNRQEMTEQVARQNTLVNQQTIELRQDVDNQTKAMHHEHVMLNFNLTQEPPQRLPLDVTPEELRSLRPQR